MGIRIRYQQVSSGVYSGITSEGISKSKCTYYLSVPQIRERGDLQVETRGHIHRLCRKCCLSFIDICLNDILDCFSLTSGPHVVELFCYISVENLQKNLHVYHVDFAGDLL